MENNYSDKDVVNRVNEKIVTFTPFNISNTDFHDITNI